MLITLLLVGTLMCDGNADGRVTIDELVAGVQAALDGDPCGDCTTCGDACSEFPEAVIDGALVSCQASFCYVSDERTAACVRSLMQVPFTCVAVQP